MDLRWCGKIVRVHDGTIEVYANKHRGTTFEVKMSIGQKNDGIRNTKAVK